MTDIVEQLRTHDDARLYAEADLLMAEAADEIERLRQRVKELEDYAANLELMVSGYTGLKEQLAELRKALQKITEVEPGLVTTSMDMRQIARRALEPKPEDKP